MFVELVATVLLDEHSISVNASLVTPVEVDFSTQFHCSDTLLAGRIDKELNKG
jgi:hypothetical protein